MPTKIRLHLASDRPHPILAALWSAVEFVADLASLGLFIAAIGLIAGIASGAI